MGQLVVYVCYFPYYRITKESAPTLGTFCTTDASGSLVNYFINEFFGTLVLVLGVLCCLQGPWGSRELAAASTVVGLIVCGLVTSLGGPTGPGLNSARDLVPRFLHWILPVPNKQ